jgi:hypothetical protein
VPKKGRARRFREARQLKQGFDDGLFKESGKSLADVDDSEPEAADAEDTWLEADDEDEDWDPDHQVGR